MEKQWTLLDIEVTRYADRLEIISPGALPNTMTIEKIKAGRRRSRNPIVLEVVRDYGYVDARGMGGRTKVIPLARQLRDKMSLKVSLKMFPKKLWSNRYCL